MGGVTLRVFPLNNLLTGGVTLRVFPLQMFRRRLLAVTYRPPLCPRTRPRHKVKDEEAGREAGEEAGEKVGKEKEGGVAGATEGWGEKMEWCMSTTCRDTPGALCGGWRTTKQRINTFKQHINTRVPMRMSLKPFD